MDQFDDDRLRARLLLQLRWASVVAQVCVVVIAALRSAQVSQPLALVGIGAIANLGVQVWMSRREHISDGAIMGAIVADVVVLTVLLAVTGGPVNPFTLLYMVPVATASVALSFRRAMLAAVIVVMAYSALFLPLGPFPNVAHVEHVEPTEGGFATHTRGMWLAFAISAFVVVAFVGRLRAALLQREARVAEMRESMERTRRLGALATLAGGAAHELSTPLSTIAMVAAELQRKFADRSDPAAREDFALLLAEVERCRSVLMQLATDAGTVGGENASWVALRELVADVVSPLPAERIRLRMTGDARLRVSRRALASALRGLVKNALQADAGVVEIEAGAVEGGSARLAVIDHGHGMDEDTLARAGEPFFTTKEPGHGMGLGVFLARAVVEQAGGTLSLTSSPRSGTRAEILLPTT
jgi:two-component system sensor histidine kinase RegB